jgi:hypothetical protein
MREAAADQAEADEGREPEREARERSVPPFTFVTVPSTPPCEFACLAFDDGARFAVVPATPAVLAVVLVFVLDETCAALDVLRCRDLRGQLTNNR